MAEKYEIDLELKSNFDKVVKNVDDLKKGMQSVQKETEDIGKSAKNAEKGVKSIGDGFKAVGLSIKAMGIGLLLEAFAILKDVFSQNQQVADAFATAVGALSIAFNDLVKFLIGNLPKLANLFKDAFDNPQKYLKSFGESIKENVMERFRSSIDLAGYLGDVLKKVFTGDFAGAMESAKKAGKEYVDTLTGVNNTVDRAGKAVEDISNAISEYGKETWNTAAANNELQKAAQLAAAEQSKLVEKYGIDAEKQRKIRDNDLLSIEKRIEANDKLKGILELQGEAMNKLAAKQLEAAQATYNLNKSTANKIALTQAETNVLAAKNQVEGLTSEQESNRIALSKELSAMKQSEIDGIALLNLENEKFTASLEKNNLKRLSVEKEILLAEQKTEKERLELKVKNAAEGTQARVDAELELKTRMQEIGNEIKQNVKDTSDEEIAAAQAVADQKKAIQEAGLNLASGAVGFLKEVAGKNKAVQKAAIIAENAISIAKMIMANNAANIGALATPQAIATSGASAAPVIAFNNITTALGVATTIAATAKALQAVGGGSAGGAPSAGGSGGSAPKFNVVGATGVNQLAGAISNREQAPVQAYVVANNVTTAQSLDRNIIRSATLG